MAGTHGSLARVIIVIFVVVAIFIVIAIVLGALGDHDASSRDSFGSSAGVPGGANNSDDTAMADATDAAARAADALSPAVAPMPMNSPPAQVAGTEVVPSDPSLNAHAKYDEKSPTSSGSTDDYVDALNWAYGFGPSSQSETIPRGVKNVAYGRFYALSRIHTDGDELFLYRFQGCVQQSGCMESVSGDASQAICEVSMQHLVFHLKEYQNWLQSGQEFCGYIVAELGTNGVGVLRMR